MLKPHLFASLLATLAIAAVLAVAGQVAAQGFNAGNTGLTNAAQSGGYTVNQACVNEAGGCIPEIVGRLVAALLGLFGALFLVLIIYGGVQYMTAGGDEKKIQSARQTIINAIIGMVVVALSYAIAFYVINLISGAALGESVS